MEIPEPLISAIELAIQKASYKKLTEAAKSLSKRYREGCPSAFDSYEMRLAYLCTRLPATYAAIKRVFAERTSPLSSLVDCGAGLGTSLWALPEATSFHLIERDAHLAALAKTLTNPSHAKWQIEDFTKIETFEEADLFLFSYSLTEIDPRYDQSLVKRVYKAAKKEIVIIEPGTPVGYKRMLKLRSLFIEEGGFVLAPCPHEKKCLLSSGDWCHFSQRLPRTPWHRLLKQATLGYEDEKFSYVILSKTPVVERKARVLRSPQKNRGHISLKLCKKEVVEKVTITKKVGEDYKKAKKLRWGDKFFS